MRTVEKTSATPAQWLAASMLAAVAVFLRRDAVEHGEEPDHELIARLRAYAGEISDDYYDAEAPS